MSRASASERMRSQRARLLSSAVRRAGTLALLIGPTREFRFSPLEGPAHPPEAIDHEHAILVTMVAIAVGQREGLGSVPFAFIRAHGARRARPQFPLTTLLHAYRLGRKEIFEAMRAQVLAQAATRDQAMAALIIASDFLMDYADVTAMVLTESYLAEEKLLSAERARTRAAMFEDLPHGLPPRDDAGGDLCERSGIGRGARLSTSALIGSRR